LDNSQNYARFAGQEMKQSAGSNSDQIKQTHCFQYFADFGTQMK
jgi:hypothetical protein